MDDTSILLGDNQMTGLFVFFRGIIFLIANQMIPVIIEYVIIITGICKFETSLKVTG